MGSPGATRNRARFPRPKPSSFLLIAGVGFARATIENSRRGSYGFWSWATSILRMPGAGFASAAMENSGRGRHGVRVDVSSSLRLADAVLRALQSGRLGVAATESSHAVRRSTRSGLPSRRAPPIRPQSLSPSTFPHTHHAPPSVEFLG